MESKTGSNSGEQEEESQSPTQPPTEDADAAVTSTKRKRKRKRKNNKSADLTTAEDASQASKRTSLNHSVYVEGIPFTASEDDVRAFFADNACGDILEMRLPRWQDSGRLRGYGHVVFDSETSRQKAIEELNGRNLGQRYLTIKEPKAPREDTTQGAASQRQVRSQPDGCKVVFVKNLPYEASEEDIWESFHVCGKILDGGVRVARNYQTQQSKGFCYVEFKNPEGAYSAVQKASKPFGMTVHGRPCFVDYEEGTMKGSYKTKEGRLWAKEYKPSDKRSRTR